MGIALERNELKSLLRERGLRVTNSRVAVLSALSEASHPVSHSELVELQAEQTSCDASTTFRTLKTLVEQGLAKVVSKVDGIDRYAFTGSEEEKHEHAHFLCDSCDEVLCLPDSVAPAVAPGDRWAASVKAAQIQLRGECPDCIEAD